MKAVIYSRFSTDRQNESSIADQVRICTEHAKRNGMEIAEYFEDQGISGTALGNRPGVLRMREAAFARRFDVLLVADLSRLARSEDLPPLIQRLRFNGVRVVGVQDGFDSSARTARMQAGMAGIMGAEFIEMVRARTYSALESRAKTQRPTGGRAYGYREGQVDHDEARIVQSIFNKFADGASCRAIAADLNARGILSPGSNWKRTERRSRGWMGSAIRVMLRNDRYIGRIVWNRSEWVKDPDTGKRLRRERAEAQWIVHRDESQRIVSDELWGRVQRRIERIAADGNWGTTRGQAKYLLSGLLRCDSCGSHYIIANAYEYGCSSFINGRACDNNIRVRRDRLEQLILAPVRKDLLAEERVQLMKDHMQAYYREQLKAIQGRGAEAPKELEDLDARIARLRQRLQTGDPDMAADEIQAAIERAEAKRKELQEALPVAKQSAVLSILPRTAEMYREQIDKGLEGDPRAALKARTFLREAFNGRIDLQPGDNGSLWAVGSVHPTALLQVVGE